MNWDISATELNLMDRETYAKHRQQLLQPWQHPSMRKIIPPYPTEAEIAASAPRGHCVDCGTDLDEPQDYPPVARHDYDGYPLGWRCYWCDQLKKQAPISSRKSGPKGVTHYVETGVQIVCVLFLLGITVFGIIMNLNG